MGLVSYQVQRENEENEKRIKELQELAQQATVKKIKKKKMHLSLPMRGRQVIIGDKQRDQHIRNQVLKQANESEEINLNIKNNRFLEQVRHFEDEINRKKEEELNLKNMISASDTKVLLKNAKQENYEQLQAKTYLFNNSGDGLFGMRQKSANPQSSYYTNNGSENMRNNAAIFAEFFNSQTQSGSVHRVNMMRKSIERPDHPTQSVTTNSVKGKDFESTGQINIITSGGHNLMDAELNLLDGNKFASIVDMNQVTNFPLNSHRKRNKNDFYRFLLN